MRYSDSFHLHIFLCSRWASFFWIPGYEYLALCVRIWHGRARASFFPCCPLLFGLVPGWPFYPFGSSHWCQFPLPLGLLRSGPVSGLTNLLGLGHDFHSVRFAW